MLGVILLIVVYAEGTFAILKLGVMMVSLVMLIVTFVTVMLSVILTIVGRAEFLLLCLVSSL